MTSTFRIAVVVLLVAFQAGTIANAAARGYVQVRTADGSVGCDADERSLRCDVRGGVKPLPPAPSDCQLDWGGGMWLHRTGPADLTCAGDTVMNFRATVVPAGTTWHHGPFACALQTASLRCTNASGHGFFLSSRRSNRF